MEKIAMPYIPGRWQLHSV